MGKVKRQRALIPETSIGWSVLWLFVYGTVEMRLTFLKHPVWWGILVKFGFMGFHPPT